MKVYEVLQHGTNRLLADPATVAIKPSKDEAKKVADTLDALTPNGYTVRERDV